MQITDKNRADYTTFCRGGLYTQPDLFTLAQKVTYSSLKLFDA